MTTVTTAAGTAGTAGTAVQDPVARAEALLDAGAVLRDGTTVAKPDTVDGLDARTYRHPVLGERRVVRLTATALGDAEDLTMEYLGFEPGPAVDRVGLVRQQALGFPAWAIVHDPANGHHALALVKDIARLARTAKSRIGPAKDGFTELGDRLARAVPHFLPTYYEEAGRAFLVAGSPSYAATMFGKAREAEQVYGLTVDEERTHTVFLEFALAGALTAKALTGYARELAARCEPAVAYERFRRLCVERTLGGMPPYAAMATDLRRLARAAKLGQDDEDMVLRDLLSAPALAKAPAAFWTAYQAALTRVCRADPTLAAKLLTMLPEHCDPGVWLTVLRDSGAADVLTAPAGTPLAGLAPPDGAAGWLGRAAKYHIPGWRQPDPTPVALLELVADMTARLTDEAVPVVLDSYRTDLDLLDLCLALGVPVADPERDTFGRLDSWLDRDPAQRRDLVAIAADDRFRPMLVRTLENHLPSNGAAAVMASVLAVPGLRTAARLLLDELADAVVGLGLPPLDQQLARIRKFASPAGLAVNPEAVARIIGHDLGPVLGRTLRAGVLDEFGWPALEQAVDGLAGPDKEPTLSAAWPHLLVRRGDTAVVVGPDRTELEHTMRIPANQRSYLSYLVLRYVDGQLLVCWDTGPDRSGYWSGTPDDVFTKVDCSAFRPRWSFVALPGGGATAGARPLRVGDRSEQCRGSKVFSDGVHHWVLASQEVHEFDPATGELGRPSLPAFLADGGGEGRELKHWYSSLYTAPAGITSPLGSADGLIGWRVRETPDGGESGTGVDGRRFERSAEAIDQVAGALVGAIRFPGTDRLCGVVRQAEWNRDCFSLVDADGFVVGEYGSTGAVRPWPAQGTPLVPPSPFLHYLRPRDEAGSAALRAVADEQAAALLAAALGGNDAELRTAVAEAFPAITHPELLTGVTGVVRGAAARAAELAKLAEVLAGTAQQEHGEPDADPGANLPGDSALAEGLSGLIQYCSRSGSSGLRMIGIAAAALTDPEQSTVSNVGLGARADDDDTDDDDTDDDDTADPVLPGMVTFHGDKDWLDALGLIPAAMYRAASPVTPDPAREALLTLFETAVSGGLLAPGSRLRYATLTTERAGTRRGHVLATAGGRALVVAPSRDDEPAGESRQVTVLEFAPDGRFSVPDGYRAISGDILTDGTIDPATVTGLVAQVRAAGPAPWHPELAGALSDAAGISPAEAGLLLAGLPSDIDVLTGEPDRPATLPMPKAHLTLASRSWNGRSTRTRAALAALLPADPALLWSRGPDLEGCATQLNQRGVRAPVPDELIAAVDAAGVAGQLGASELLHGLSTPQTCAWLAGPGSGCDDDDVLYSLVSAIPWLVYHLPVDAPVRDRLADVAARLTARLAEPTFQVPGGYLDEKSVSAFQAAVRGTPTPDGNDVRVGPYVLEGQSGWRQIHIRPAAMVGAGEAVWTPYRAFVSEDDDADHMIRYVLDGRLTAVVAGAGTRSGDQAVQNPAVSVPDLVADVATALGSSSDAAVLYLQLLALPDPTDRKVAAWTGWKPARLKAARAELAATPHVVQAKRARAGRSLFLPGGWLALRSPHPPVESWKIPLLTLDPSGRPRFGPVVPALPVPELFATAWARVRNGDGPRFEQLVTEARR